VNDDEKWRQILRGLNKTFYHQTVDGTQIEKYVSDNSGHDLSKIFDQYLRDIRVPVLEYSFVGSELRYRWSDVVKGFDMPVKVKIGSAKEQILKPGTEWKKLKVKAGKTLEVDRNFYVNAKMITN